VVVSSSLALFRRFAADKKSSIAEVMVHIYICIIFAVVAVEDYPTGMLG